MKEYYSKQFRKSALKLELARIGYESKMKTLGSKLATADESQHDSILEAINELRTAIKEMEEDAKDYKVRFQEACAKEGCCFEEDSE